MGEANQKSASFVRWQATTLAQFGYVANLTLALAVATLGFQVNLLLHEGFVPPKCLFTAAILTTMISVGLGLWLAINRLQDFRITARIARMREGGDISSKLDALRARSKKLGKRTWCLFRWQLSAFGVGVLLSVVTVAVLESEKLF
jgi:hypothetical protein